MLPTVSPKVLDGFGDAQFEDPPPLVDIPSSDVKVDGVPPLVVHAPNGAPAIEHVVFSIDHRE